MTLPFGWVAYAPLSQSTSGYSFPVVTNTAMMATVKNGRVVAISFPGRIRQQRALTLSHLRYTLSDFGSAPPVRLPVVNAATSRTK
jgi:hypothetical protein